MKTKIICDKEYARSFRKELTKVEFENLWREILSNGAQFYNHQYKPNITNILIQIPRYSGFEWSEFAPEELPIYLVDKDGPSISDPLTLKVRGDLEYMLTVLIHELTHVNMPSKLIRDSFYYEDIINQITIRLCSDIGITSGINTINDYRSKMEREGYKFEDISLSENNVKTLCKIF